MSIDRGLLTLENCCNIWATIYERFEVCNVNVAETEFKCWSHKLRGSDEVVEIQAMTDKNKIVRDLSQNGGFSTQSSYLTLNTKFASFKFWLII